jgi:hypothetical protein
MSGAKVATLHDAAEILNLIVTKTRAGCPKLHCVRTDRSIDRFPFTFLSKADEACILSMPRENPGTKFFIPGFLIDL